MKTITFNFPSPEVEALAIDVLAEHFGYPKQVRGEPVNVGTEEEPVMETPMINNPASKEDFCRVGIRKLLADIIRPRIIQRQIAAINAQLDATLGKTTVS